MKKLISRILLAALLGAGFNVTTQATHMFGVSLDAGGGFGALGVGGSVFFRPVEHFGLRAGFQYAEFGFDQDAEYDGDPSAQVDWLYKSAPVTLDYYPWKNNYFRISAGVLLNRSEITVTGSGDVEIDGTPYPNETVNYKIQPPEISPYLAIGGDMFCFDKAKHWALGWELGFAYGGSAEITTENPTGGIPPSELAKATQEIEDDYGKFFGAVVSFKVSLIFRF
jgi:hypothetical protein